MPHQRPNTWQQPTTWQTYPKSLASKRASTQAAADVDDRVGLGRLLCAFDNNDREGEGRTIRLGVVARHAHDAAPQAGHNIADIGQIAT